MCEPRKDIVNLSFNSITNAGLYYAGLLENLEEIFIQTYFGFDLPSSLCKCDKLQKLTIKYSFMDSFPDHLLNINAINVH